jgi:hypothetical protein
LPFYYKLVVQANLCEFLHDKIVSL